MRHRYTAAALATILMAASVQAQNSASQSRLVAIGNGATTPLCKRLAAIADSLSGASGPSLVRAIPEDQLIPPFARIWSRAEPAQLTPDLIRHIAQDRYRPDAQRELDSQKPLGAPGAVTIAASRYDARAEEIGVPRLRAAIGEGKLVVEHAAVDVVGSGKPSTAVHIGIRSDAQQAYHLIDWTVHLLPDAGNAAVIAALRDAGPSRHADIIRYGGKDYLVSPSMAARHVRLQGTTASIVTICEGTARLAADAAKR
jgi:hypothetical protein